MVKVGRVQQPPRIIEIELFLVAASPFDHRRLVGLEAQVPTGIGGLVATWHLAAITRFVVRARTVPRANQDAKALAGTAHPCMPITSIAVLGETQGDATQPLKPAR